MTTVPLDISTLSRDGRQHLAEQLRDYLEPDGAPLAATSLARDALRASEMRYRRLFESAKDGILILDADNGMIVDVNPFLVDLLGYSREAILDKHVWDLGFLSDIIGNEANFWELRQQDYIRYDDKALKTHDGTRIEVEFVSNLYLVEGHPVIQCNIRDISERQRAQARQLHLESQLRRAQRLESIGTLAGGIAHDLNNALAPILMATELLRLEFPGTAADDLGLIEAGARRGTTLVKQLLSYARGAEGDRLPVALAPLFIEVERMIRGTFPKNIELRVECAGALPAILGDATRLHQILLNLAVNVRDAMPEGGTLTLEARETVVDATLESDVLNITPGRYVVLRVTDTGSGIPPEIIDRIFDPFFTTKTPDRGTGLGLATTIGIVKGHAGFIRVYSTPGQGTTFRAYLPAYDVHGSAAALPATPSAPFVGHGETILVVDDEASVRDILRRVLTKMNFTVVTAPDGAGALREVAERGTAVAAVITDLHMPHLDGTSFVRALRTRLPGTGVIVVSGLVGERERNDFTRLGVRAVLDKPFTHADLVRALRTVFSG